MTQNGAEDTKIGSVNEFPANLDEILEKVIEKEGYIKYEILKRNVSASNSNLLSSLFEIDVKGTTKDGEKEINLFMKNIRLAEEIPGIVPIKDVYKKELFVYKELFKMIKEIQEEANVPISARLKTIKFYEESTPKAIIMENMQKKGFQAYNRMSEPSLKFVQLSVQELAKFHGISFVIKEKRPDYFEKKLKSLKESMNFNETWQPFLETVKTLVMPCVDEIFKKKIEKEYEILVEKYPSYFKNDINNILCLSHGDYRPSNILGKMKNGEVDEVIAVDYQFVWYGCPVYDFINILYFSTDRDFRKAHMSDLKDLYHETLSTFLKYFDIDSESVYPRKEFEKAYKDKLDFGLARSLIFLVFAFVPEDGVIDLINFNFHANELFKAKIRGVIEDYIEWGYL